MNKALVVILAAVMLDAIGIGLIFPILPALLREAALIVTILDIVFSKQRKARPSSRGERRRANGRAIGDLGGKRKLGRAILPMPQFLAKACVQGGKRG